MYTHAKQSMYIFWQDFLGIWQQCDLMRAGDKPSSGLALASCHTLQLTARTAEAASTRKPGVYRATYDEFECGKQTWVKMTCNQTNGFSSDELVSSTKWLFGVLVKLQSTLFSISLKVVKDVGVPESESHYIDDLSRVFSNHIDVSALLGGINQVNKDSWRNVGRSNSAHTGFLI